MVSFFGRGAAGAASAYAAGGIIGATAVAAYSYLLDIRTQRAFSDIGVSGKTEDFSVTKFAISTIGSVVTGKVSSKVFSPNVGRNPKQLTTILTGKQMQKEITKATFEQFGQLGIESTYGNILDSGHPCRK